MSWSSRKKKEVIFCTFYFVNTYVLFVFYLNVQCIEYTSRICILLHLKKHYLYTFLIDFKIVGFTEEILNGNLHFLCSNYPTWKPWFIDNKTITFYVTWMFCHRINKNFQLKRKKTRSLLSLCWHGVLQQKASILISNKESKHWGTFIRCCHLLGGVRQSLKNYSTKN